MNLTTILAMIKTMVPVLEPIGEQGVNSLFDSLDAVIAKLSSPDERDILQILAPAFRAIAIKELQKIKGA